MAWVRIDNIRRVREYAFNGEFGRVYGRDGELWPRISAQIVKTGTAYEKAWIFSIRRKENSQESWYDYPMPDELMVDFSEMVKEFVSG